jgi:hypothetical protein
MDGMTARVVLGDPAKEPEVVPTDLHKKLKSGVSLTQKVDVFCDGGRSVLDAGGPYGISHHTALTPRASSLQVLRSYKLNLQLFLFTVHTPPCINPK